MRRRTAPLATTGTASGSRSSCRWRRCRLSGWAAAAEVRGTAFDIDGVSGGAECACAPRGVKEADVDERSRVLMATFMGAVIGGVWGWLYMTENGRRIRDQIEPKLDDFMGELSRVRSTVEKARNAADEGWRSL